MRFKVEDGLYHNNIGSLDIMEKIMEIERKYHSLTSKFMLAETKHEEDLAMKKIDEFEKKHPVEVDEIRSRRWIIS
ncbi:MAG: hypothetical protein LBM96_08090 [Methanobrevibacter sp.]|jgi:hypothetical protein|nr:hypothetical protein [Candidatus Methanoflexus mossambicus]